MYKYQNGKIRLDIHSKYKTEFEFAHFLYEYESYSFLTSQIQVRTRITPDSSSALLKVEHLKQTAN